MEPVARVLVYFICMSQDRLVRELREDGVLKTALIISAFKSIDRADFVPTELQSEAYKNIPLPIGHGQTISQPWTVAFMLELLQLKPGQNILDIGSGSGWQTALLASIVGPNGHVTALELISDLCEQSLRAIDRYGFILNGVVNVYCADATNGFIDNAPYDRIVVAAMADTIPPALIAQLANGGILIIPIQGSIWKIIKKSETKLDQIEYPGFAFVPFKSV